MYVCEESKLNREINKSYKRLANSIVIMAIKDYINAINRGNEKSLKELEEFFKSNWCNKLSPVSGDCIIRKLKSSTKEERYNINELLSI